MRIVMKGKGKYLKLVILISVIVVITVICTAIITTRMVSNIPDSVETSAAISELEDRLYDNAEIISCTDGMIVYKWNGKSYQCAGELEKAYLGVADIEVKKHQIVRVKVKKQQAAKEEKISVLLKNGDDICYKSVWISSDKNLYINGKKTKRKQLNISEYMNKKNKTNLVVTAKTGKLYYGLNENSLKKQGYEGVFSIIKENEGYVIVNEIGLEDYLRYVLPSEMPSSFSMEALKAQAICARTFAYSQMNGQKYIRYGANLDDSTSYQVYNATGTTKRADEAVKQTKGKVITCNGRLVNCYYFSTSSGMTEDMEIWSGDNPSYIKKVKSKDTISPFYTWCAELDLKKYYDKEYGKLKKIKIDKMSANGYVLKLTAEYEKQMVTYTKEINIRHFLGNYLKSLVLQDGTIRTDMTTLPSASFQITKAKGNTYILKGGGHGHGIGMSQYGAEMMAQKGKKCAQILKYYYKDIKIDVK